MCEVGVCVRSRGEPGLVDLEPTWRGEGIYVFLRTCWAVFWVVLETILESKMASKVVLKLIQIGFFFRTLFFEVLELF